MNFLNIFNWLKLNVILPSFVFKNRIIIIYAKNLKKIFNMLGFTYKNNMWYVEKFNNILNLLTITRLVNFLSYIIFIIFLIRILDFKSDLIIVELINMIDTIEIIMSSFLFLIYWLFVFVKLKLISFFTNNPKKKYVDDIQNKNVVSKLNVNFFDVSETSDTTTLFTNVNMLNTSQLYSLLYKCVYMPKWNSEKCTEIIMFILKSNNTDNSNIYKISNFGFNVNNLNVLFNEQSLKKNILVNISNDKFEFIKSIKLSKWLFNYFGSNKNNYSYLYGINTKFNFLWNTANINKTDIFNNIASKNSLPLSTFNQINNNSTFCDFNKFITNNRFFINTNFFILNKMSTLFNLNNNNLVFQLLKISKNYDVNKLSTDANQLIIENKQTLLTHSLMSVNMINFHYHFNTYTNLKNINNKELKKLFFFK